ncbi:MAG TPA: urate hydroxylase PuuD [Azospirillaceae bacterium]|nr:urate hydroxylase PuuD [Azospirillaceae bacterium]
MASILENLYRALGLGILLAVALMMGLHGANVSAEPAYLQAFFRYLHVFFGILWIGLLYYFNFVQIPTMPKVPAELKPGVSKFIAPEALFWFRWAALLTVVTGLFVAMFSGYLVEALTLAEGHRLIGVGMWLALIMAFNVWFIIWPNQKKALGLVEADADTKAKAARVAMLTSRTNFVLSIPMLYAMATFQSVGG